MLTVNGRPTTQAGFLAVLSTLPDEDKILYTVFNRHADVRFIKMVESEHGYMIFECVNINYGHPRTQWMTLDGWNLRVPKPKA